MNEQHIQIPSPEHEDRLVAEPVPDSERGPEQMRIYESLRPELLDRLLEG